MDVCCNYVDIVKQHLSYFSPDVQGDPNLTLKLHWAKAKTDT